jgi:hypothetical protein
MQYRLGSGVTLVYGVPAFHLWKYEVGLPGARTETVSHERNVHVLPDGTLLFDGQSSDGSYPGSHAYHSGMINLARSGRAAHAPGQGGMTYRDLRAEHFGQYQERGFAELSKRLLDASSTR